MPRGPVAYKIPGEGLNGSDRWYLRQHERKNGRDSYYPCAEEVAKAALAGVDLDEIDTSATRTEATMESTFAEDIRLIGELATAHVESNTRQHFMKAA